MRKTPTIAQRIAQHGVDIALISWISIAIAGALLLAIVMSGAEFVANGLAGQAAATTKLR